MGVCFFLQYVFGVSLEEACTGLQDPYLRASCVLGWVYTIEFDDGNSPKKKKEFGDGIFTMPG